MPKTEMRSFRMDEHLIKKISTWLAEHDTTFSQFIRVATLKYLILEERKQ